MTVTEQIHGRYVYGRRVRVLAAHLADLLPPGARVLDVGCGDGLLDKLILGRRSDVTVRGLDVLRREQTHIPVDLYDGARIPCDAATYDVVMFVDALHHTTDVAGLLREAARVSANSVIIKDHIAGGWLARPTLRFMDAVGNARFGVHLPHNYWTREQWEAAFDQLRLTAEVWKRDLKLYPLWADWLFGRGLHFITRLMKEPGAGGRGGGDCCHAGD